MSQTFRVLYDFSAEEEGELSVSAGEVVVIVEDTRDGWTLVETVGDQPRTGYVPGEYLGDADEEAPPPGAVDDAMTSDAFEMGPDAELDDPVPHDAGNSSPAGATPQGAPRSAPRSARGQAVPPPPAGRSPSHRPEPASGASAGADTAVVADDPETPPSHRLNTGGRNGTSPTASWRESSLAASGRRAAGGGAVAGPIVPSATDGGDYDHMAEALGKLRLSRGSRQLRKPDSVQAAASSEEFDEMIQNHQQWLDALATSRATAFGELAGGLDRLANNLEKSQEQNEQLYTRLDSLCRLIDEERQNWERRVKEDDAASA